MWLANGVYVSSDPITVGKTVDVKYSGLLSNSGADGILLHCGADGWSNVQDVWMERQNDGTFSCTVTASADHELNMCFKDTASNWDNNNGWNWKIGVV